MDDSITAIFAERHPGIVASLLNEQDTREVSEYLQSLPPESFARVAAGLESTKLKAVLAGTPPSYLAKLIAEAPHEAAITIVAHIANNRYHEIIDIAEDHRPLVEERLHAFSLDTLGAVASPSFLSVRSGTPVADLLALLEDSDYEEDSPILLLSDDNHVLGILPPLALFSRKNTDRLVDELAEPVVPLEEQVSVHQALAARQWENHEALPVVCKTKQLVGVVHRSQLIAISRQHVTSAYSAEEMIGELLHSYFGTCGDLLEFALYRKPQ